ncbi:Glutathione synthase/RimK-type ligase, ATP-grasp superfamily [Prauserella aidingensis]|nr:Glutathione synthase/RimK-type ligase, ATP-grasp superfamily [Prauserella aidingensis]
MSPAARTALLVGCAGVPQGDGDEHAVPAALADVGVDTRWAVWDDPAEDFAAADLVILRSTWDYTERREEFLAWCASVPGLVNRAHVVRWNTDKAYLLDLATAGVDVVPTALAAPGEKPEWPGRDFVVKPSVGAGSRGAARFTPSGHEAAARHLEALHDDGYTAVVQPYQPAVDSEGETALVFFGGQYSHAFTKGPMLSGADLDESGLFVTEKLGTATPDGRWRALAEDALDAAAVRLGLHRSELLYARVDLVRTASGEPAVLELEVSEPSLGFRQADPDAPVRFASAVRAALTRSR